MANLIAGTDFETSLRARADQMTDADFRRLVFAYCQRYQEVYWFDQLVSAFAYIEISLAGEAEIIRDELPSVLSDVEDAMGEYFISLNEVASAVHRLLNDKPFTAEDTIECIGYVWNAHACNEVLDKFRAREDQTLRELLGEIAGS